jgi:hypothetical protein
VEFGLWKPLLVGLSGFTYVGADIKHNHVVSFEKRIDQFACRVLADGIRDTKRS